MKKTLVNLTLLISFLQLNFNSFGQADALSHSRVNVQYLGWDATGTAGTLDIKNGTSNPIDFYVNGGPWVQFKTSGDVNVVQGSDGYQISDNYVLRYNVSTADIFVGVGAGNGSMSGHSNTLVGNNAGSSITTGASNTAVGTNAATAITTGFDNTVVGESAANALTSGEGNTAIGYDAMNQATTMSWNTAVGWEALSQGTTCPNCSAGVYSYNTAVGYKALRESRAYGGTAVGYNSGLSNVYGCRLTAVGESSLGSNTTGDDNTGVGANSLSGNTSMSRNTAFGWNSLSNQTYNGGNTMFSYNTAIGGGALGFNNPTSATNGIHNTAVGGLTGLYNKTGYDLTFLGYQADLCGPACSTVTLYNSTAIGANAIIRTSNSLILGGNTLSNGYNDVKVGIGLSNDASGPQSSLEINSYPNSTSYTAAAGTGSGLQFRQLITTSSTTYSGNYIAPYGKVLTVDGSGIVKLTDDKNDIGFGKCNSYVTLSTNAGMDLTSSYNVYFKGQARTTTVNNMYAGIGLGYSCGDRLPGKLSVEQMFTSSSVDVQTVAGFFHNGDVNTNGGSSFEKIGVDAICDGNSAGDEITNIGGDFSAQNAVYCNIGARGRTGIYSLPHNGSYGNYAFGGYFLAQNSAVQNIGAYGYTDASGSNINYGIYGSTASNSCGSGSCVSAAAYFNGDVYCTTGNYWPSDNALKSNVQPLNNNVDVIKSLAPKTYTYNQISNLNLPNGTQAGLIAQEVQSVLPQLIGHFKVPAVPDSIGHIDTSGTGATYLGINYVGLIPYLIGAVKEQQENIDSLNQKLSDLQDQISRCCSSIGYLRKSNNVNLSDPTTIVLNQNSPNPFSEQTYITFNIPSSVTRAMIIIYDKAGNVLKSVEIEERGEGSLHIFAEKLSSGIYTYMLVADGVTMDTKQMICTK